MPGTRVWARLLGVEGSVVEGTEFDEDGSLVVSLRLRRAERHRCGVCRRRCSQGRRRWRALDLGTTRAYLEAEAPRIRCPQHGVVVAAVPWARHDCRFSRSFEDQAAWLTARTSRSAVVALMRVAWRSVGAIVEPVVTDARSERDPLDGLVRIGIDEISHRKGQRYLTVVVDHDSGHLVWATPGADARTLNRFFDELGEARTLRLELISADAATWIAQVTAARCPAVVRCLDPFHVVARATAALDVVRREVWNAARQDGRIVFARELKGARFVLWRTPSTSRRVRRRRWRASPGPTSACIGLISSRSSCGPSSACRPTRRWPSSRLGWGGLDGVASRPSARSPGPVREHRRAIEATLVHRLSNARVEAVNTRIRLLTRIAFGFHSASALIALTFLGLGGYCPGDERPRKPHKILF